MQKKLVLISPTSQRLVELFGLDKDSNSICNKDEIIETMEEEEIAIDENITEEIVEEVSTKEKTDVSESEDDDKFKTEGLHWTHMPITYNIFNPSHYGVDCGPYESNKIRKGFSRIQNDTNGVVHFKEIENLEDADIVVSCAYIKGCYEYNAKQVGDYIYYTESICGYDKGIATITESEGNNILKAEIVMVGLFGFSETRNKEASGFYIGSCGHPSTEIHEILHAFGYEHVNDDNSIMYFQDDEIGATKLNAGE